MRKGLKNLLYTAPIALASFLPSNKLNAQDSYTVNPFVQPNDSTLNWYGSGDSNGDDTLTVADLQLMRDYIDGNYTPDLEQDPRAIDRMNVDGDSLETVTENDYNIMADHFQNRAPRDPAHYWANLSAEGKEAHLQRMLAIDKTNETQWEGFILGWDCNQYTTQLMVNFHGFPEKDFETLKKVHEQIDLTNNGRFNLPMLSMRFFYFDADGKYYLGHELGNIIMKNNFFDLFNSQNFVEPQNDSIMRQSSWYLTEGQSSKSFFRGFPIAREGVIGNPGDKALDLANYFHYETENDITGEFIFHNDMNNYNINLITQKPAKNLGISTDIKKDSIYEVPPIVNVNVLDPAMKLAFASEDSGLIKKVLAPGNNQLNFNLDKIQNEIMFYLKDIFDRDTIVRENITVNDIYAPRISADYSQNIGEISFNGNIVDPNFKEGFISVNGEKESISESFSKEFNLDNGNYRFVVSAIDKNNNEDSIIFNIPVTGVGVGLENKVSNEGVNFYPNPVNNLGKVEYSEGKTARVDFWDVSGRQVATVTDYDKDGQTEFDFSNFKPGMYAVRVEEIETGKVIGTRKIIKK
jgi:type IX secretion system substrate protein